MTALLAGDSKSLPELAPFTVPQIRFISLPDAARDDKRFLRGGAGGSEIARQPGNGSILRIFTARREPWQK
jgi:hypothetical protein